MSLDVLSPTDKLVRKLRKKLRQIEHLELTGRSSLNDEEKAKVKQKNAIRTELAQLLKTIANEGQKSNIDRKTNDEADVGEISEGGGIGPIFQNNQFQDEPAITSLETVPHSDVSLQPLENPEISLARETQQESVQLNPVSSDLIETMKRSSPANEVPLSESASNTAAKKKKARAEVSPPKPKMEVSKKTQVHQADLLASSSTKSWHESSSFFMNMLEAHNDLVVCVDFDEDFVVSGSRDTCVQVWCAKTGSPLMNLRGHTNTVTCVSLLSNEQSKILSHELYGTIDQEKNVRLVLTGSLDCCLTLWNIENGTALRSIYTFSGITALRYLPSHRYCILGSEGGKLEMYAFHEDAANPLYSLKTFENSVSSIQIQDQNLVCSSLDGFISVWIVKETELSRVYKSEDLISESSGPIFHRPVLSLAVSKSQPSVFYGDEGATIKMLSWRTGVVKKLRNHVHDFGITNALATTQSFLLSSSLDLDTGTSSINIRSLPDLNYLGSLKLPNFGRILCLAAVEDEGNKSIRMAVGGTKLVLIETRGIGCRRSPKKDSILKPERMNGLTKPVADSEGESSCSSDEMEDDVNENEISDQEMRDASESIQKNSWCLIL